MENKIKLIIFDFDGVLADSFDCFLPLIRASMKHIGFSLTRNQYRDFFMGDVHQGFMDFINNKRKYSTFSKFRKENFNKYYKPCLFTGAVEILKELKKNYILTIASSGKRTNIVNLLKKNKISNLFDIILATTEYTKENMIREILRKSKMNPEQAVMITDTAGDLKVAKKSELKTVAVTWGFHSAKILKSEKPDYLANSFKMLYKNIKAF